MLKNEQKKNKQLEIRIRDLELELSRATHEFHRKEAEISKQLVGDREEIHNDPSSLVKQLQLKLADCESELISLRESESKMKFEFDLLIHQNVELKKKISESQSTKLSKNLCNSYSIDSVELSPNNSKPVGLQSSHTEESDRSGISEDAHLGEQNLKSDLKTPDKSKKNRYYRKYLYYKGLASEIQHQLQETKDRAIVSLVEKEKSFIKQKQELN